MAACPTCKKPLENRETPMGAIPGCEACTHAWFTEDELSAYQQAAQRSFTPDDLLHLQADIRARQEAAMKRPVEYLSCPGCDRQLLRRTFGMRTFLLVHYCVEHGYWVHDDDLAGIVDFVTSGGEILELQSRIEQLEENAQQLRIQRAAAEQRARTAGAVAYPFIFPI